MPFLWLKTNIWERLKLIQRLKKDFASTKQEFEKEFEASEVCPFLNGQFTTVASVGLNLTRPKLLSARL